MFIHHPVNSQNKTRLTFRTILKESISLFCAQHGIIGAEKNKPSIFRYDLAMT